MKNDRNGVRRTSFGLAAAMLLCASNAFAQFCPGATTYFASNYALPSCTVGTCWSATPFTGSTAVTGSTYPSTNYACAAATPAAGAQENTLYTYDNNGNLTVAKDPLAHQTTSTFDALNRLTQVLDPSSGTTNYTYDGANNLTQVTDPRNNATLYTYDGLNNLTKLVSPDTGTTTSTYDPAGNLLTKIDARGVTSTYTYDVLNRVTEIVYNAPGTPSETHAFTYDVGPNANGKLTTVTDPVTTTTWTYNSQGRVASKSQGPLTVTYGYNSAGQLTTITTPSGQTIGYGYINNRAASVTVNGVSLLAGANTTPFGPIAAWQWGNGLFTFRNYDHDGRLASWEFRNGTSILRKNQSFDTASRITAIADPNNPAASQAYQYDVLDRLSLAQTTNPVTHTQQFTYDGVGNRQTATIDGSLTNLTYSGSSNQLATLTGATSRSYIYDGAGNPTTIAGVTYIYNNAGRLVSVQNGSTFVATYQVNALGQSVSKTGTNGTTLFVYDEQGHLLGEYNKPSVRGRTLPLIQETVWLEDLPVATLRPTGGKGIVLPISTYYVHADHLGSPRAVTRPSDNVMVWQWDNVDPFGNNAANENPAGQGTFKYATRFPGQYYDSETGTHYNYFRDYDPGIGRYEQSDPIGLKGGINTYAYARSNPARFRDPLGLEGCGAGPFEPIIPNNPIFHFEGCCDKHDNCYDDCRNKPTKRKCDDDFYVCMAEECNKYLGPGFGLVKACMRAADEYADAATNSQQSIKSFNESRKNCNGPLACL